MLDSREHLANTQQMVSDVTTGYDQRDAENDHQHAKSQTGTKRFVEYQDGYSYRRHGLHRTENGDWRGAYLLNGSAGAKQRERGGKQGHGEG